MNARFRLIKVLQFIVLVTMLVNVMIPGAISPVATAAAASINLAAGKSYTSSTSYNTSPWSTSKAFDGDPNTAWRHTTADTSPWLQVDLGISMNINQIKLRTPNISSIDYTTRPVNFELQYSNDLHSWTSVYKTPVGVTDSVGSTASRSFDFTTVQGRYVRFWIPNAPTPASGATIAGISEFEVYLNPPAVSGVVIDKPSITLGRNGNSTLNATVLPVGADQSVSWSTSNPTVATVNSSGEVSGIGMGHAMIRATSVTDATYFYETDVNVIVSDKKEITAFSFHNMSSTWNGSIDESHGTISVQIPEGVPFNSLVAHFQTVGESVYVNDSLQISGVTANNFSTPITYRVVAEDQTSKAYVVTVTSRGESQKELTSFSFNGLNPAVNAFIDGDNVNVVVPSDTNLTALVPSFAYLGKRIELNGTIPISGVTSQDFSNPVTYTVFADDNSFRNYTVNVYKQLSGNPVNMALGTKATATSTAFYKNPPETLVDGKEDTFWRRMSTDLVPNYATIELPSVSLFNKIVLKEALRNGAYRTVSFSLYASTDGQYWTKLHDGGTITQRLEVSFSTIAAKYVRLVVTADDTFDQPFIAEIEVYNNTMPAASLMLPSPMQVLTGELKPIQAAILPTAADQRVMWSSSDPTVAAVDKQGLVTGVSAGTAVIRARSISNPTIQSSTQVTVQAQISTAKDITAFTINNVTPVSNTIENNIITVTAPFGTDVTHLIASYASTGNRVTVNGTEQKSDTTVNNFTDPVIYTVWAADGTKRDYTVQVVLKGDTKEITSFRIDGLTTSVNGTIFSGISSRTIEQAAGGMYTINDNYTNSIELIVPEAADISHLVATFETSGDRVEVNGTVQTSGVTANDFSNPVLYTVKAQNGTTKTYKVTAYKQPTEASVIVTNQVVGKTMKNVGFSGSFFLKNDNIPAWLKYANVNAVRYWVSPTRFITEGNVNRSTDVNSVAAFDAMKNDLRAKMDSNMTDNTYLNWPVIKSNFDHLWDGTAEFNIDYNMQTFKELGLDVIVEMHDGVYGGYVNDTDPLKWQTMWKKWQAYYAEAFYLAKNYGITKFEGPNEPEVFMKVSTSPEERAEEVNKVTFFLKIIADAVKSAVEDVNRLEGTQYTATFAGPTLASSGLSDIAKQTMNGNRTNYRGEAVNFNLIDVFVKHTYSSGADDYGREIDEMNGMMQTQSVNQQALPIMYTEFNYAAGANWKTLNVTGDTPKVFRTEAMTWQTAMDKKAQAMYQFKSSNVYTGINGNAVMFMYDRSRDPAQNLVLGKSVTASSNQANASKVVDGDSSDGSAWISGAGTNHTLEIDLEGTKTIRQVKIDLGDALYDPAQNKFTGTFGNFKLQYLDADGVTWKDIVNITTNANNSAGDVINPVTTSKLRLTSTATGPIKIREVYASEQVPVYDIGGPMKNAEVTRLFAEGFKNARDLYATTAVAKYDANYEASTAFDPETSNYYIWMPQTSDQVDYRTTIDLSALDVKAGNLVSVREVSDSSFGGVVYRAPLAADKKLTLMQPKQSVWLVTVSKGASMTKPVTLTASEDAQVSLGSSLSTNFGTNPSMSVRQSTSMLDNNSAAYLKFPASNGARVANLNVFGTLNETSQLDHFDVNVYGISDSDWTEETITGSNAPHLNARASYLTDLGVTAEPLGMMTFTKTGGYSSVDVTEFVKRHAGSAVSFVLIKEKRNYAEVNDNDIVVLSSREGDSTEQPVLELWSSDPAGSDHSDPESPTAVKSPSSGNEPQVKLHSSGEVSVEAQPILTSSTGIAKVTLSEELLKHASSKVMANERGDKTVSIDLAKVDGALAYELSFAASTLDSGDAKQKWEVRTEFGNMTVPSNLLRADEVGNSPYVSISIAKADKSKLEEKVRSSVGDRPFLELNVKVNDKTIAWRNPGAPVTVAIPYKPSPEEQANPEHIVIWYVDGQGHIQTVANGKYSPATGVVTFTTTHFSSYAVNYVKKSFEDLLQVKWAQHEIEVLAAKGIISGTSETTFHPLTDISRADFLLLLIQTLGLTDTTEVTGHDFTDVSVSDYYYDAIAIAAKLGIAEGYVGKRFIPLAPISRQDMMVYTARALQAASMQVNDGDVQDLKRFPDNSDIASYALSSVAMMVKEELIQGDAQGLNPTGLLSRAEAAVLIYRLYNQYSN
jgi:hypothetical protein